MSSKLYDYPPPVPHPHIFFPIRTWIVIKMVDETIDFFAWSWLLMLIMIFSCSMLEKKSSIVSDFVSPYFATLFRWWPFFPSLFPTDVPNSSVTKLFWSWQVLILIELCSGVCTNRDVSISDSLAVPRGQILCFMFATNARLSFIGQINGFMSHLCILPAQKHFFKVKCMPLVIGQEQWWDCSFLWDLRESDGNLWEQEGFVIKSIHLVTLALPFC